MSRKLKHVGIAVSDLNESVALFGKLFQTKPAHTEIVKDQMVRVTFLPLDGTSVELLEPTSPESPITKFLDKRGEGIHHLSFEVIDLEAELARLKSEGFQLIDEKPRRGAEGLLVAFIHPKSTNGVLVELCQRKNET